MDFIAWDDDSCWACFFDEFSCSLPRSFHESARRTRFLFSFINFSDFGKAFLQRLAKRFFGRFFLMFLGLFEASHKCVPPHNALAGRAVMGNV